MFSLQGVHFEAHPRVIVRRRDGRAELSAQLAEKALHPGLCLEPGGSARCYWNGYGTQWNHPAQWRPASRAGWVSALLLEWLRNAAPPPGAKDARLVQPSAEDLYDQPRPRDLHVEAGGPGDELDSCLRSRAGWVRKLLLGSLRDTVQPPGSRTASL